MYGAVPPVAANAALYAEAVVPLGKVLVVMVKEVALNVIVALAVFVASAAPVAVTVTELEVLIVAGAVYRPLVEIVPTAGFSDQVTAVFVVPETVAVNC